eukprot:TRINITY_DN10353_c0_g3_i1.p1 TRINITY_DN10353_c0_g3~~TRINITY_DN10353_c0_g3_i1.p1  ORF type:complete len:395 (-),score=89.57 TRINITY_DN10353_c0_g3_i1:70-1254(-)
MQHQYSAWGCFQALQTFLRSQTEATSRPLAPGRECSSEGETKPHKELDLEAAVLRAFVPRLDNFKESLSSELQGVTSRLSKAKTSSHSSPGWRAARTMPLQQHGAGPEELVLPVAKREWKRRWTTPADSIEGSLRTIPGQNFRVAAEDLDTPASTVVSCAASDVHSDTSQSQSRPSSLPDQERQPKRRASRISFQRADVDIDDSESDRDPCSPQRSPSNAGSDTFSLSWRANSLDFGENLAAEAAAKKGTTSVDSIIALVQTQRERWDEEKQALEAQLEELKERLRLLKDKRKPDAEKEALKAEYQELRKAMKARSRFGAWVCERHLQESDDEEDSQGPQNAEKEELRRRLAEMSSMLRAAREAAGTASSESDISPALKHGISRSGKVPKESLH